MPRPSTVDVVVLKALGALALILAAAWAAFSYAEACAYERVTGHRVSTWDAMFLDLGGR